MHLHGQMIFETPDKAWINGTIIWYRKWTYGVKLAGWSPLWAASPTYLLMLGRAMMKPFYRYLASNTKCELPPETLVYWSDFPFLMENLLIRKNRTLFLTSIKARQRTISWISAIWFSIMMDKLKVLYLNSLHLALKALGFEICQVFFG